MISTLERDNSIEGILFRKMKELPDWYGLTSVGFVWHGERWIHDDDGRLIDGRESDEDGFKKFMLDNKDEVYELIELAMESEE